MQTKDVLAITVAVLGGAVLIVGLIYIYLYCTRIRPKRRRFDHQDSTSTLRSSLRTRSNNLQLHQEAGSGGTSTPPSRPPMNPLILLTYVQRMRAQKELLQAPDSNKF